MNMLYIIQAYENFIAQIRFDVNLIDKLINVCDSFNLLIFNMLVHISCTRTWHIHNSLVCSY